MKRGNTRHVSRAKSQEPRAKSQEPRAKSQEPRAKSQEPRAKSQERIHWVDVLKCIGIFEIYLGHFGSAAGLAYPFVFTHHVPLFFFIAGAMESNNRENNILINMNKKIKSLLIPFFFFAFLAMTFQTLYYNYTILNILPMLHIVFKGAIRNSFFAGGLWFLTCLFCISIIFIFLKKVKSKFIIIAIAFISFFITSYYLQPSPLEVPSWIYNLDSALYYLIYYVIGYSIFPIINLFLKSNFTRYIYASGFLASIYSVFLFFQKDILQLLPNNHFTLMLVAIVQPIIVIWMLIVISYALQHFVLLQELGKDTLYLCGNEYVGHMLVSTIGGILGLGIIVPNPFAAVIYSIGLLMLNYKVMVPWEKRILSCSTK